MIENLTETEIISLWNMIFNMAIQMLHDKNNAEDAVQKIFIKLVEKSKSFEHRSAYKTWAYRVAYNFLIDEIRKKNIKEIPFDQFESDINNQDLYNDDLGLNSTELKIYVEQIKTGCTLAMLQCLNPEQRHIYILGMIFRFPSQTASEICNLSPEAYRKALSRSKLKIQKFVKRICGLVNPDATCHCKKRITIAKKRNRLESLEVKQETGKQKISEVIVEMEGLDAISQLFQSNPFFDKSELYFSRMKEKYQVLREK